MDAWRTAIATSDATSLWVRGYDITALMKLSFADMIFLLHQGRLPNESERRLLDAILIGVADHGANAPSCAAARLVASGNRQSLSAAVAAGVLAIGDEHGGTGSVCMELIAEGVERAERESISLEETARRITAEAKAQKHRLPGFGHRVHHTTTLAPKSFSIWRANPASQARGSNSCRRSKAAIREQIRPLTINIDGALAAVLFDMGFPAPFGKLVFIIGRVAGLTAEVAEEYAREKAMRIRIPVTYDGPPPREIE